MIYFKHLIAILKKEINNTLPGKEAHKLMRPDISFTEENNARKSSILILLYPEENEIKTLLILRKEYNGFHSHQISFPGGKFEDFDKSLIDTALREAHEEIGIDINSIKIIGQLTSLYIPISNFLVFPLLGYSYNKPILKKNNFEVEKIIEINISDLLNPVNIKEGEFLVQDRKVKAPFYNINNYKIWGATAMIISELLEIIKKVNTVIETDALQQS